jgi:ferredoxin
MPKVDKEKCIGCGTCVVMCPDCFKLDEEGKAESSCDGKCDCNIDDVISACPVDAITK